MNETKPMRISEAVEVMKILAPYAPKFTETDEPVKVMKTILEGIFQDMPSQSLRLISLMERVPIKVVAEEMFEKTGLDLIGRISKGFTDNHLRLLMNAAFTLKISESYWEYDDGRE